MAARRALRRCAELGRPHFSSLEAPRPSVQQEHSSGRAAWSRFRRSEHCYAWHGKDEDERRSSQKRQQPGIRFATRNVLIFGTSASRTQFVHPQSRAEFFHSQHRKFSLGSVRFCSTEGAIRAPASFVGAAQNVELNADLAGAAATYASEIQAATSVSFPWTAVLQNFINLIHVNTGIPWWGSIALATVIVRAMVFPLTVYQVKLTARFSLLRPELEKIKAEIAKSNYDQAVVAQNKKKMNELFERHKTNPFTPLIGALVQAPVFMCFFFGIRTMASTMESFKQGGALWFTDLSSADPYYLLPILTGLSFLVVVELGAADGMQGQPTMKTMKNIMRVCGVLLVPLTASFPTALFSYWLTSNFWTMAQGAVLRNSRIKAYLDIPETAHLDPANKVKVLQSSPVSFTPPVRKPVVTLNAPAKKSRTAAQ